MRSPSLVFNSARDTLYRILGPSQSSESQTRIAVCTQHPQRPLKLQTVQLPERGLFSTRGGCRAAVNFNALVTCSFDRPGLHVTCCVVLQMLQGKLLNVAELVPVCCHTVVET